MLFAVTILSVQSEMKFTSENNHQLLLMSWKIQFENLENSATFVTSVGYSHKTNNHTWLCGIKGIIITSKSDSL